jgi:hypothetical protein
MFVLFTKYYLKIQSWKLRWAEHAACMNKMRNAFKILVGKPKGKRELDRPRSRWEENTIVNLKEMGHEGLDWIIPQAEKRVDHHVKSPLLWSDVNQNWNAVSTNFGKTRQYQI